MYQDLENKMDDDTTELDTVVDEKMLLPKWFALQTLSNQESKVKAAIQVAIKEYALEDVILEILLPTEKVVEIKNGKKYTRTRKFYPGYVFIRMRMYDPEGKILHGPLSIVKNINGVVRFVGDREPVELKQSEIDDILTKVEAIGGKPVPKITHEVGETVKISDGPFLNLTGTIEDIDTERGCLRVNVSMFGRLTPVDLEFWQVERFTGEEN
ncbi:MAG: transcription termination/antitermination protein NusG [Puniceicoccales bacterium]|jgi:transcriptional antiterminator NusG|nr:transcription termination/antitermination protein NusG [Puniceicoccales bacterium]